MVVSDPILIPGWRPGRLDAPQDAPVGQDAQRVIHRLARDGTDLGSDVLGNRVRRDVGTIRNCLQDGQALRRDLDAVLTEEFGGFVRHGFEYRTGFWILSRIRRSVEVAANQLGGHAALHARCSHFPASSAVGEVVRGLGEQPRIWAELGRRTLDGVTGCPGDVGDSGQDVEAWCGGGRFERDFDGLALAIQGNLSTRALEELGFDVTGAATVTAALLNGSLARYTLTADDDAWTIRTNFSDIK